MTTKISRVLNSRFGRVVRAIALLEVVAAIFNTSIDLPTSLLISDAHAQQVPEMSFMLVPVFIAMTGAAFLYMRRRMILV